MIFEAQQDMEIARQGKEIARQGEEIRMLQAKEVSVWFSLCCV